MKTSSDVKGAKPMAKVSVKGGRNKTNVPEDPVQLKTTVFAVLKVLGKYILLKERI